MFSQFEKESQFTLRPNGRQTDPIKPIKLNNHINSAEFHSAFANFANRYW